MVQKGLRLIERSQTLQKMIHNGEFIQAIKEVRSTLNASLRDAKDAVDAWRDGKRPVGAPMSQCMANMLLDNAILRGAFKDLTSLEMDALKFLIQNS